MLAWFLLELVLLVALGSLAVWGWIAARAFRGADIVPYVPRRPVPWGLPHLIVIMAGALLLQSVAALAVAAGPELHVDQMSPTEKLRLTGAVGLASLLAALAGAGLLVGTVGATRSDLGLPYSRTALASDLKLGLLGFLAAVGPVYAIQVVILLIHHGLGEKPADHPLVTMLRDTAGGGTLAVAVLTAICVAPIFEEFIFRLILQGWLEKLATPWTSAVGDRDSVAQRDADAVGDLPTERPGELLTWPADSVDSPPTVVTSETPRLWPVLVSSALFAAMHLGHGFDPIPLFFLALGLGYLYWRTHRIVPCIVMHAIFNAFSLTMLGIDSPSPTN